MNTIKSLKTLAAALCAVALVNAATAATWNDAYGMGNNANDWLISGSGVDTAVVQSVHSNALYYITSAKSDGAPRISSVLIKPDSTPGTLKWYQATNVWTIGSNETAGATAAWLVGTNAGMATNDILVLQHVQSDSYQFNIVSGNATSATGLISTNAAGYNRIKLFNTVSNAITAGDKLWKMTATQTLTPLSLQNVTNDVAAPWGNWWALATRNGPITYGGAIGKPGLLVLTFSNSAGLFVQGDYYVRQRR